MRVSVALSGCVLCLAALAADPARACFAAPPRHVVDGKLAPLDFETPDVPTLEVLEITRGRGPVKLANGYLQYNSTDGTGVIVILVRDLADDLSAPGEIGARVRCIGNCESLPRLYVPDYDVELRRTPEGGTFYLLWEDGRSDEQEPIAFTIEVYAVDRAGNVSAQAAVLSIEHPGCRGPRD